MSYLPICLLLILPLSNSYPLYSLYNQPYQLSNPLGGLNSTNQQIIVIPDQSQLIIVIQLEPQKTIDINFFRMQDHLMTKIHNVTYAFDGSKYLIDAFWVGNQYLLIMGDSWKVFYRPPFNTHAESYSIIPDNLTSLARFIRAGQSGEYQLTTIYKSTEQWLLRKQTLTYNSSVLVEIIPLCKIESYQQFVELVKLKNFQCAVFQVRIDSLLFKDRFQCFHLDSSSVYTLTFQSRYWLIDVASDQTANTIYTVQGNYESRQIVRYELFISNNSIQTDSQLIFQYSKHIQNIHYSNNQIVAFVLDYSYYCKGYILVIEHNNTKGPFLYQLLQPNLPYCYYFAELFTRQKEIYVVPPGTTSKYDWFYASRINSQPHQSIALGVFAIFAVLILAISFKAAANVPIYQQVFKIEQRGKITLFQFALTLIILPAATLLQVLSTDTAKSMNFAPSSTRAVSLESYTLKVFNLLFIFTSLISTVFQTYTQHRSKSRYLNGLIKHGLALQGYFIVKQHLIVMKALIYSTLSTYFLVSIDSDYSSEQFQLYPTTGQVIAISVAYFACFFTAYNTSLLLVYYFVHYWLSMCVSLSMTFLIAFFSGDFYLNNVVSIEQLGLIAVSPQALFSAITQHVFKTEVRFNQENSAYLLFGALIVQTTVIFVLYKTYLAAHYGRTSFSQLTSRLKQSSKTVINQSEEGTSGKSIEKQLICSSVTTNELLDVFIPCKLSKNEGFDFSIVEHPFDQSAFFSLQATRRKTIQLQQLKYYLKNNALQASSQQEEAVEVSAADRRRTKSCRILKALSKIKKNKVLLYSQFQAILYRRYRLWQNNRLYLELMVASAYSWVQCLLWYKVNREMQYFDSINMLIAFCFLHTSIFSFKQNSPLSNKSNKTQLIGGNPLMVILANRTFDFLYILISFVSNLLLQTLIINVAILGDFGPQNFFMLLSGFLYILNYTFYVALLSQIVKRVDFIFAIIMVTHMSLIGLNFNSFILSYSTYYFSVFQVLKYIYFPLTTMYLYESLTVRKEVWAYILCLLASALLMSLVLMFIERYRSKKTVKNRRIPNHENIHNEPIDNERVFIENIENRSKIPLICQDVIHKYSNSKEVVVKNFSCHINSGEIFGLLGHNGCGKTTIFNIVAGAVSQSSGIVEQFGQEKGQIGYLEKLNRGYCPQSGSLEEEMTVEQNIRFVGMIKGLTSNYITKFMLLFLKYFRLKGIEQVKVKYLSQAEKKKIAFIIAFLGFPKLLYFDEITSGVEQESRKRMLELMRSYSDEYNASIFFSTHNINEAESYCDRVSIMKEGVMKNAGEPMKLRASKHHEFYLLQMSFIKSEEGLIVEKKKSKVKQFVYSLAFFRIEFEGNFRLIYSLDMLKVNMHSVWKRVFFEFYKKGVIEKFVLKRHGLEEVVKQSLNQDQEQTEVWKARSEIFQP